MTTTRYWITVDKGARTVTIYYRGKEVLRFLAVIGKPATPTPDGLAAIWERDPQPDPQGFLGPWAMPLTVLSNALFNLGGGRDGSRSTAATARASTIRSGRPHPTAALVRARGRRRCGSRGRASPRVEPLAGSSSLSQRRPGPRPSRFMLAFT